MPILDSAYIPNWHVISYFDINNNNYYKAISERLDIKVDQSVNERELIQGDAGSHVFDVGGTTWNTTLSSELLIFKEGDRFGYGVRDLFDLLIYDFNTLRYKLTYPNSTFLYNQNLLTSATVNIGKNLNCNLQYNNYFSDKFGLTVTTVADDAANLDFVARVAKYYDTRFYIDGSPYLIQSGSMNIKVGYKKMYLFNTNTNEPFYSPETYSVNGSVTLAIFSDEIQNTYVSNQIFLTLFPKFANVSILVDDRYLSLGQASLITNSDVKIEGQLITATVSFKTYARKI